MRKALLIAMTTAAGLGACAPVPGESYGYGVVAQPAPSYGYYDGGYAPAPYYAEPVYGAPYVSAPYVSPGPSIFIGGERRYDGRDRYREERYRDDRPRYDGGYRGNPYREGRQPSPQNFGGGRPVPAAAPAPINRPPPPQAQPPAPRPSGPPPGGGGGSPFGPSNPQGERG